MLIYAQDGSLYKSDLIDCYYISGDELRGVRAAGTDERVYILASGRSAEDLRALTNLIAHGLIENIDACNIRGALETIDNRTPEDPE